MIAFIRKLRRRLLAEGALGKYLAYAVGEIVLVVVGILIALQINNYNDARKDRVRELGYLANIRADLMANITEMDSYLATRTDNIAAARRIISHFEGVPIEDASAFNDDGVRDLQLAALLPDKQYLSGTGELRELRAAVERPRQARAAGS
jgi:hypothetical protein